jgi:hypothetical protein
MAITFNKRPVTLAIREKAHKPYRADEVIGFRYADEPTDEHFEAAQKFGGDLREIFSVIEFLPGMDESNCVED